MGARPRPVALVQPLHAIALIMDVVGDVLQVLQVGSAQGSSEEEGHQVTVPLCHTTPPQGDGTPCPIPCSPDQQVPQEGELAVRRVLHCKARQHGQHGQQGGQGAGRRAGGQGGRGIPGERSLAGSEYHWSIGTASHHHPHPASTHPGRDAPMGAAPSTPSTDPLPYLGRAGGTRGSTHLQ